MEAEEIHDRLQRIKARASRPKRFMVVEAEELTEEQLAWRDNLEEAGFQVIVLRMDSLPAPKGRAA